MITGAYDVFDCRLPEAAVFVESYFRALDSRKALRPLYRGLRKTIPVDALLASKMPLPNAAERREIIAHLDRGTEASGRLGARILREIALLREFRARLTADVVTGQLDVRDIAARLRELGPDDLAPGAGDLDDDLGDEVAEFMEDVET